MYPRRLKLKSPIPAMKHPSTTTSTAPVTCLGGSFPVITALLDSTIIGVSRFSVEYMGTLRFCRPIRANAVLAL